MLRPIGLFGPQVGSLTLCGGPRISLAIGDRWSAVKRPRRVVASSDCGRSLSQVARCGHEGTGRARHGCTFRYQEVLPHPPSRAETPRRFISMPCSSSARRWPMCFPPGPETERRRQAASDRCKRYARARAVSLSEDPKAVSTAAIDDVIKLYDAGFRKLALKHSAAAMRVRNRPGHRNPLAPRPGSTTGRSDRGTQGATSPRATRCRRARSATSSRCFAWLATCNREAS